MNRAYARTVGLLLLISTLPGVAAADTVFSFNGVGDPIRRVDTRSRGMGGAGRALSDGANFGSVNPAVLASFKRAGFSSLFFAQHRSIDDGFQSWGTSDGDLGAFRLVIPVRPGTVISVGLEGLTDVDYGLTDTLTTGTSGPFSQQVKGSGGIQALTLAAAHAFGRLQVGLRLDLILLGTVNETWTKTFDNPVISASEDEISRTHRGVQPSFGLVYQHNSNWSLGFTGGLKSTVTQSQVLSRYLGKSPGQRILGWREETKRDVKLPASLGAGLAYTTGYRWTAALDLGRSFWGGTDVAGRHDASELAAGVMYRTGSSDMLTRARRFELMAGLRRRSLYFQTPGGEQVKEWAVSAGVGLPIRGNGVGNIRYVMEFGSRGDVADHGLSERFVQVAVAFSGWVR